jgi:hypothetical protein
MTGEQYQNAIDHLGMTQVGSARFFGVAETTPRRWISGKLIVPRANAMLLRVMLHYSLTPDNVLALEDRVAR